MLIIHPVSHREKKDISTIEYNLFLCASAIIGIIIYIG